MGEVCVEEIKVQTLVMNPAVVSIVPHNKILNDFLFNV